MFVCRVVWYRCGFGWLVSRDVASCDVDCRCPGQDEVVQHGEDCFHCFNMDRICFRDLECFLVVVVGALLFDPGFHEVDATVDAFDLGVEINLKCCRGDVRLVGVRVEVEGPYQVGE